MDKKGSWTRSVIKVGTGRGFVVAGPDYPYVITAAHCLPTDDEGRLKLVAARFPSEKRTFQHFLGPLNQPPTVPAKVVFVDPIADLAVLGMPDGQGAAYEALLADARPLPIARPVVERRNRMIRLEPDMRAYVLSLDRQWRPCKISFGRTAFVQFYIDMADITPAVNVLPSSCIEGGMSGSPIVLETGEAIGVIVTGAVPQAFLAQQLPVWLLDEMTLDPEVRTRARKRPDLDLRREQMRQRLDRSGTPSLRT